MHNEAVLLLILFLKMLLSKISFNFITPYTFVSSYIERENTKGVLIIHSYNGVISSEYSNKLFVPDAAMKCVI